jgi:hypothetical protein
VLDADARLIVGPVARVPGDVLLPDRLADGPVGGADGVVGRDLSFGVLEPVYGARPGTLGDVDDYRVIGSEAGRLAAE